MASKQSQEGLGEETYANQAKELVTELDDYILNKFDEDLAKGNHNMDRAWFEDLNKLAKDLEAYVKQTNKIFEKMKISSSVQLTGLGDFIAGNDAAALKGKINKEFEKEKDRVKNLPDSTDKTYFHWLDNLHQLSDEVLKYVERTKEIFENYRKESQPSSSN